MQKTTQRRRLVGIAEAAEYAGVCTKTIRRRISDGTITGYRLGARVIRVLLNALDEARRPTPRAMSVKSAWCDEKAARGETGRPTSRRGRTRARPR